MNVEVSNLQLESDLHFSHEWLEQLHVCFVPGKTTPLLEKSADNLLAAFKRLNHIVQEQPDNETDLVITTAIFGQPVKWRESLLFNARRRFKINHFPTPITLVHIQPDEFRRQMDRLEKALALPGSRSSEFQYAGLRTEAHKTLYEQGKRGGPILALQRIIQAQTMSLRVSLLVGDQSPSAAYLFDLVGAYPRIDAALERAFYDNITQRLVTAQCSGDVTKHEILNQPITSEEWDHLDTPAAMRFAGRALDARNFFTDMVVIDNLIEVPALNDAIASQYSEGCYATWEPKIGALISTITGSARPVRKGAITDNELAVIVATQQDGKGVVTRPVSGLLNNPPSSEAFEMFDMDVALPKVPLADRAGNSQTGDSIQVPVVRSKLHGHRGISAFNPAQAAFAPLEDAYYHFPVTCGSAAQAMAIKIAFSRCDALMNPEDARMIAFTILPGHGIIIAEKWDIEKRPFQLIWEAMDDGSLQIQSQVPQGAVDFQFTGGLMRLKSE